MFTMNPTRALTGLPLAGSAPLPVGASYAGAAVEPAGRVRGTWLRVPEAFTAHFDGTGVPFAALPVTDRQVAPTAQRPDDSTHIDVPNGTTLGIHTSRRPSS